jgi:hypothetical protein
VPTFLSVLSAFLVGLVLSVAPWWTLLGWDTNYFLNLNSFVRSVFLNGFTRGAVTGLGLANLVLAFHEAHEYLAGPRERS